VRLPPSQQAHQQSLGETQNGRSLQNELGNYGTLASFTLNRLFQFAKPVPIPVAAAEAIC
jgi:hypothetical protein